MTFLQHVVVPDTTGDRTRYHLRDGRDILRTVPRLGPAGGRPLAPRVVHRERYRPFSDIHAVPRGANAPPRKTKTSTATLPPTLPPVASCDVSMAEVEEGELSEGELPEVCQVAGDIDMEEGELFDDEEMPDLGPEAVDSDDEDDEDDEGGLKPLNGTTKRAMNREDLKDFNRVQWGKEYIDKYGEYWS